MTETSAREPFAIEIVVLPEDIDALGHVNNVVYLRWVQDAAAAHWTALTSAAEQAATWWVVVRHEIDYLRPAAPGERLLARTWVGTPVRRAYERHTEILRDDSTVLARARTLWVPLDPVSRRPTTLDETLHRRFSRDA